MMADRERGTAQISTQSMGGAFTWMHGLNLLLLLALWGFTVATYNRLPELIPGHVGFGGVTRWVGREGWFLFPILGTFSAFLMYVISTLTTGVPSELNVPYRKRLQALPPEEQLHALVPVRAFTWGMAGWLLLLMLLIQHQFYRIALDEAAQAAATGSLFRITAAMLILFGAGMVWLYRTVRKRIDAFERKRQDEGQFSRRQFL